MLNSLSHNIPSKNINNGLIIGYTNGIIMRVATKRWGEVTIKKQGSQKNQFDKTKSFSIQESKHEYTVEQLHELFTLIVNLSEKHSFDQLRKWLCDANEK